MPRTVLKLTRFQKTIPTTPWIRCGGWSRIDCEYFSEVPSNIKTYCKPYTLNLKLQTRTLQSEKHHALKLARLESSSTSAPFHFERIAPIFDELWTLAVGTCIRRPGSWTFLLSPSASLSSWWSYCLAITISVIIIIIIITISTKLASLDNRGQQQDLQHYHFHQDRHDSHRIIWLLSAPPSSSHTQYHQ